MSLIIQCQLWRTSVKTHVDHQRFRWSKSNSTQRASSPGERGVGRLGRLGLPHCRGSGDRPLPPAPAPLSVVVFKQGRMSVSSSRDWGTQSSRDWVALLIKWPRAARLSVPQTQRCGPGLVPSLFLKYLLLSPNHAPQITRSGKSGDFRCAVRKFSGSSRLSFIFSPGLWNYDKSYSLLTHAHGNLHTVLLYCIGNRYF